MYVMDVFNCIATIAFQGLTSQGVERGYKFGIHFFPRTGICVLESLKYMGVHGRNVLRRLYIQEIDIQVNNVECTVISFQWNNLGISRFGMVN